MGVPANDPVEVRIIEDIQSSLEAISTTHPTADFFNNVGAVQVFDTNPADTAGLPLPCLVLVHEGTTHEWADVTGLCENTMTLAVFCLVEKQSTWRRDIARLSSDVRRALQLDHQRGNLDGQPNAFDTSVIESLTANTQTETRVAMARLTVSVTYRDSFLDPTESG